MLPTRLLGAMCVGLLRTSPITHFDFNDSAFNFNNNNNNNNYQQIYELRRRVRQMEEQHLEGNMLIDAQSQLIILLARSIRKEDRNEGLALGEAMWQKITSKQSPIPPSSRTTMCMMLCTTMRRCALKNKDVACTEKWTNRFAKRTAHLTFDDFDNSTSTESANENVSDEQENTNSSDSSSSGDSSDSTKKKNASPHMTRAQGRTPLEKYRREIYFDHPLMQRALNRPLQPGPRYTD